MTKAKFSFTPGKQRLEYDDMSTPVTEAVVGHCLNCEEPVTASELGDRQGECFSCHYGKSIRTWRSAQ